MTANELDDYLVEFIGRNTYELRYRSNEMTDAMVAPQVYAAFIPRNQVGEIIAGEITAYPAVIVRTKSGVESQEYEKVTVELLICIFDDTIKPQQGYKDVIQLIYRIKSRLKEQGILRTKFPLRLPVNWQVNQRSKSMGSPTSYNEFPYYFGEMQMDFEVRLPTSQYEATTMTPDVAQGRYDTSMIPEVEQT